MRGTGKLVVVRRWTLSGSYERASGLPFSLAKDLPGLTVVHRVKPATFQSAGGLLVGHFVSASGGSGQLKLYAGAEEFPDGALLGHAGIIEAEGL